MKRTTRTIPLLALVAVLALATAACGSTDPTAAPEVADAPATAAVTEAAAPTDAPAPTATPEPTPTVEPTDTPAPTATPEPAYRDPVPLLELTGQGEMVTDNYELPACDKAVFYWHADANAYGTAALILDLHKVGVDGSSGLVNEAVFDVPVGIDGAVLQPLFGGEYYFTSENTDAAWSLRGECQDGQAPVEEGALKVGDFGNAVTGNYVLPACDKSVFAWWVEPNEYDTAAIIIDLCKVGSDCGGLVNALEMDTKDVLEGEALQPLSGGTYYLATGNLTGPWAVLWECLD